ncbi:MAG TPA: winged helix-turn-helix domain-containing protein [Gammaproteobacteria bacterium]|nr:winged helix-turn-helix domain-containing protein [Gammaproteobacteria bacterium]
MTDPANAERLEFAGFRLDRRLRVLADPQGDRVHLTAKAFDALLLFVEQPGVVIERATLMQRLWPDTVVEENNLTQTIAALRRALGEDVIATVPRRGYQFTAAVRALPDDTVADARNRTVDALSARSLSKVQKAVGLVTAGLVLVVGFIVVDIYVLGPDRSTGDGPADATGSVTSAVQSDDAALSMPVDDVTIEPSDDVPATSSTEALALFQRALGAINRDGYYADSVIELLNLAIDEDPYFAQAYLYRGIAHMLRARNSMNSLRGSPQHDPQTELERARIDAERAVDYDPSLGYAHALAAGVAIFRGQDELAQTGFDRALELSPEDPAVLTFIAAFYLGESRVADARELVMRIVELGVPLRGNVGELLNLVGMNEFGRERLLRLVELEPDNPDFHLWLGTHAAKAGDIATAQTELRIAEQLLMADDVPPVRLLAARLSTLTYYYGRIGHTADARRVFDALSEVMAEFEGSGGSIGWIEGYLGIGDAERAWEWARIMAAEPAPPFVSPQLSFVLNSYQDSRLDESPFIELRRQMGYRD